MGQLEQAIPFWNPPKTPPDVSDSQIPKKLDLHPHLITHCCTPISMHALLYTNPHACTAVPQSPATHGAPTSQSSPWVHHVAPAWALDPLSRSRSVLAEWLTCCLECSRECLASVFVMPNLSPNCIILAVMTCNEVDHNDT